MSTYFREHLQCGSAQFTVPRSSLPNLLEWTERIQARFKVTIQIQWELEQDIGDIRDTKAIRWVTVQGRAEDCKKAKIYISTFCDPSHKQNFTYPEEIHSELEKMQVELEESYSTVLQFLKRGQLLIKSNDEVNLMMVVSFLEDIVSRVKSRKMGKSESGLEGYIEESHAYSSLEDDLEVDSILDEDYEVIKPRGLRQSQGYDKSAATSKTPLKTRDPEELLKGEPLLLRCNSKGLIPGQIKGLYPPLSQYESSISPDRKKIKSLPRDDQRQEPKFLVTDARVTDSSGVDLFTSNLNSQQKLAIQRILHRGEYTVSEINRLMQRVGNNWECSDLITMLLKERNRRQIPQSTSGHEMPRSTKLENLKDTQEYLMKSLMTSEPSYHFTERGSSPELLPMEFSTQLPEFSHVHDTQPVKSTKEVWLSEKKSFSDHRPVGKYDTIGLKTKSAFDETDSIIDLSNDVIIIPSESDSEKPIEVSSEESDTPEVFLVEHFAGYGQKKTGSRTSQHTTKPERMGRGGKSLSEEQRAEELRGVVDTLKQELKNLQDKMEREKAEASSHQQVVTLLQQTQQEEMQRQYEQQQQKLLEQQRLFQQQFELQERRLKAEQETALKRLQQLQEQQQQQQKEQAALAPDDPSEALVIAPARKNLASPLRPIVIDGSNVAMSHGRGQIFSCRGIAICIHYFQKRGHQDITVFVPQGRRTQNPNQIDRPIKDQKILEQLEKQGLLSFTPSRRIGNNYVNCYDDRFIVKLAVENDGVIVSNDNYRDLMGVSPKWKYVIENRLVMYTFAGDRFMIPDDPLGKSGPRIEQVLRRTPHPGSAASIPGLKKPGSKLQQPPAVGRVLITSHDPGIATPQATKAGATPWVAGGVSGAQVVKQGTPAARGRGAPALHSTGNATSKQKLAAAFDRNPTAGQVARDLTQYPNYEKLMAIFPDNKDEVLQVLTKHGDKDDANELVMLVLAEKEISGSK